MIEDKIEISDKSYYVMTQKTENGVYSKIFLDTFGSKTIVGEIPMAWANVNNKGISMQAFHKKILSTFMKLIYKSRGDNPEKLKSLLDKELLTEDTSDKKEISKEKSTDSKEKNIKKATNNETEEWHTICHKYLPSNI